MKTVAVKALALEVLASLPPLYSAHVIEDVFCAIEAAPAFQVRYDLLSGELSQAVVNQSIGKHTAQALGAQAIGQVPSSRTRLSSWYSLLDTGQGATGRTVIEIAWPHGPERIEVDLASLDASTAIRQTEQRVDATGSSFPYETTSTVTALDDGWFLVEIDYDHERNLHIDKSDSYWGTTTLRLRRDTVAGKATWRDRDDDSRSGDQPFVVLSQPAPDDGNRARRIDEQNVGARTDISSTDRELLITARRGQGLFRAKVLRLEPSCRLTGVDDPAHLRASHIKPWAASDDRQRLDGNNGLMLAPHIDHLFDRCYISFEDNGKLLWRDENVAGLLKTWGVDVTGQIAPRPFTSGQRVYLKTHRECFKALQKNGTTTGL